MSNSLILFADEVIHTSDRDLSGGTIASVVITGIAVVFLALAILIGLVWVYGKIFQTVNARADKKKAQAAQAVKQPEPIEEPSAIVADDTLGSNAQEEIVAVIAAAIAAYGAQTGKRLMIKSIKPSGAPAGRSAWSAAGLAEATRPF